jgi:Protein of unknown function (DUF3618)
VDEGTRQGSPQLADEQKTPDEIRRDIEQTRVELGDTVEAIARKTDVKSRAQERVADVKQTAQQQVAVAKESAQRNPVPFAVAGALAAAFVLWRLSSR